LVALGALVVALALSGCARGPKVTSFTPDRGTPGDQVTIRGERFGSTAADNTVKFGSLAATIIDIPQPNTIIASVPVGAATGLISVMTEDGTGLSDENFIVDDIPATWTFMVYVDGDNNLEDAALDDFLEMAAVGSNADLNIVAQVDRVGGHADGHGDWTDTRRFLISSGNTPSMTPLDNLGEQNMGDPAVLQDFVEWAVTSYPAQHYALSIWNHGGGWRLSRTNMAAAATGAITRGESDVGVARAVAWDDTDNDKLYIKEVQNALTAAKANLDARIGTAVKLDIVGFDACLMGMLEVAYALRDVANFMVGSEENEPADGWPYDVILQHLKDTPAMTPRSLAGVIVTDYHQSYTGRSGITQSALDLAELGDVVTSLDALVDQATAEWAQLAQARANSVVYHPSGSPSYWGTDLRGFADEVAARVSAVAIRDAAVGLRQAIDDFIVSELHSSDMAGSHGVAIYFPPSLAAFNTDPDHGGYEQSNSFMPVDFVLQHSWDEWLQNYYANIP
jgi:hypothetical protein